MGETGFDFYHDKWAHDLQEDVFLHHLDLARRAGLPVVIHTRDAAEVTLRLLGEHAQGLTVILHCFSLPDRLAEVVDRGYYISFAGNVTYKNAAELQEAARIVPAHLLLLETDAPWLTPTPLRGRPNRPALVAAVYEFVARSAARTSSELAAQVQANVLRAFPRVAVAVDGGGHGTAQRGPKNEGASSQADGREAGIVAPGLAGSASRSSGSTRSATWGRTSSSTTISWA